MTAVPAPKSSELLSKANDHLMGLTHHCAPEDWIIKSLRREAGKLMNADPFSAHLLLGKLHECCGESTEMAHHYDNAKKLGGPVDAAGFMTAGKCNLGYFSEAQQTFAVVGNPVNGVFSHESSLGVACFAILKQAEFFKVAEKMELDLSAFPVELVRRATSVMNRGGLCDADLAAMLDVAGSVMREHHLFYQNTLPDIEIDDVSASPCIYVTYRFGVPEKEAADLYDAFVARLVATREVLPDAFHISFRAA